MGCASCARPACGKEWSVERFLQGRRLVVAAARAEAGEASPSGSALVGRSRVAWSFVPKLSHASDRAICAN